MRNKYIKIIFTKIMLLALVVCYGLLLFGCKSNKNKTSKNKTTNKTTRTPYSTTSKTTGSQSGNTNMYGISENAEDYIGDLETFVYGLITNNLEYLYSTFPAYVELSDSQIIYGIAYTDYSTCYSNDEETENYIMCGFLPYCGELEIDDDEFNSGLLLYNLDYQDEYNRFFLGYKSDPFTLHCVVYGTYLKYGVNESGIIFYEGVKFDRSVCDESLGSLYSYDQSRYLYNDDIGNFEPIPYSPLIETIDYDAIEEEVNEIIRKQDVNYSSMDIENAVYYSHEAILSYLNSLDTEDTFLGFNVSTLIEIAEGLDPLECLRVTDGGLTVIDIELTPPEPPSLFVKWLVGVGCGIVAVVGMAASIVFAEIPPLSSLAGAITGVAIELFMEVVVENKALGYVDWKKVGVAAACGAISGFVGPYINALNGIASVVTDTLIDGVVGGIEKVIYAVMDGESFNTCLKQFGYGMAMGCAMSGAFKLVSKAASFAAKGIKVLSDKIAKKIQNKLLGRICNFVLAPAIALKKLGNFIGEKLTKLKKLAEEKMPALHSKFIGKKLFYKSLANNINDPELLKKSMDALKKDGIMDMSGNAIDKDALYKIFKESSDGNIGYFNIDAEKVFIVKKNGIVSVAFDDNTCCKVVLNNKTYNKYTSKDVRKSNFEEASKGFKEAWVNDPSKCPTEIREKIAAQFPDETFEDALENTSSNKILNIIKESEYVLHENSDLVTVSLVPRALHDKANGYFGASHMGGASLEAYVKNHFGKVYFDIFTNAASTGAVIAYGGTN